jgi:hypothetical protein
MRRLRQSARRILLTLSEPSESSAQEFSLTQTAHATKRNELAVPVSKTRDERPYDCPVSHHGLCSSSLRINSFCSETMLRSSTICLLNSVWFCASLRLLRSRVRVEVEPGMSGCRSGVGWRVGSCDSG